MRPACTRDEIEARIASIAPHLAALDVVSLELFGSAARDELGQSSDVDVLVRFANPATFDNFMDLRLLLIDTLGRGVDLVTAKAVKPRLMERIERDLYLVA